MTPKTDTTKKRPGPDPKRVKIDGDWEDAVGVALKKKRPPTKRTPAEGTQEQKPNSPERLD